MASEVSQALRTGRRKYRGNLHFLPPAQGTSQRNFRTSWLTPRNRSDKGTAANSLSGQGKIAAQQIRHGTAGTAASKFSAGQVRRLERELKRGWTRAVPAQLEKYKARSMKSGIRIVNRNQP